MKNSKNKIVEDFLEENRRKCREQFCYELFQDQFNIHTIKSPYSSFYKSRHPLPQDRPQYPATKNVQD